MVRARLAYLALAGSLLWTSGCGFTHDECHNGGWFSRFRLTSHSSHPACDCDSAAMAFPGADSVVVPPNALMPPNTLVPPGGFVAPPPTLTTPPAVGRPPRITPIPQANPTPYAPQ
jgi:hypothetical protein